MIYFLLLFVSLLTCFGQICQKQAVICWQSSRSKKNSVAIKWLTFSIIVLAAGMLFWLKLLQLLPLSIAYPMLSINFINITLIGRILYQENISVQHWIGVFIIIFGVILLNL